MADGVLWSLVNPNNLDILGSFQRGADMAQKAQIENTRRNTLAQLAGMGNGQPVDYQKAVTALAAAGDLQGAAAIGQLYGQQDDRQFRRDTSSRDFAFRQQESERAQKNADRSYGLQGAQFNFTKEQANKPQIVQVEDPNTGIKIPYAFNPLSMRFTPLANGGVPGPMPSNGAPQVPGQPQIPGQQTAPVQQPLVPSPPPGVDVKEWRKQAAKNAFGLTQALPTMESTVKEIDQLIAHPGLNSIAGPIDQYRPSVTMGSQGRDALARYEQLKGRAFLQAYNSLRGGGQITEVEGAKAQNAMARLDRAQSEEEFKTALKDFRDAVEQGMNKIRGARPPAPAQSQTPQIDRGAIEQELRRRGAIQ